MNTNIDHALGDRAHCADSHSAHAPSGVTADLFDGISHVEPRQISLSPGATLLRAFALAHDVQLLESLQDVIRCAPFRFMMTPGGYRMSVAMTNCGTAGWITDRSGYRYDSIDPLTGRCWPALPPEFALVAVRAAVRAGFAGFSPDACLINRYEPGARLSLHQDKNERDLDAPIVSVSLGLPAVFLFGGLDRGEKPQRVPLSHGDVVVWGGPSRLRYHGVMPLKEGDHRLLGRSRVNLTFRKAR
jgi:DNA oxidative demethylase